MPAVASIAVSVKARTAGFRKGMKRAQRRLKAFGIQVRAIAGRVAKFGAAMTAVGIGIGTLFVKQQLAAGDALAKTADKLGLTTEALAGLRLAAKLSGVDVRKLDMGIQRMTRRVAEAAQDTGEAKAAIKELGLDARKLAQLPVDQQFAEIADAMAKVPNQADRVRLGFKLFDSEGVALINTLALGRKGLDAAAAKAERFGLAIGRDAARRIERANDALTEMRAAIEGTARQLAVNLAPGLTVVANVWRDKLIEMREHFDGDFTDPVVNSLAILVDTFELSVDKMHSKFAWLGMKLRQIWTDFIDWYYQPNIFGMTPYSEKWTREYRANLKEQTKRSTEYVEALLARLQHVFDTGEGLMGAQIRDWYARARQGAGGKRPSVAGGDGGGGGGAGALRSRLQQFMQISPLLKALPGAGAGTTRPVNVRDPQNAVLINLIRRLISLWERGMPGIFG